MDMAMAGEGPGDRSAVGVPAGFAAAAELTAIEAFSGAGGMSLGLLQAHISVRHAFDLDTNAIATYRHNIGDHAAVADARSLRGSDLLLNAGLTEVDILSGGPPCQGFSKQRRGAHLVADGRNDLVREYARLVKEVAPRAFLFENVLAFGQKRGRELIDYVDDQLPDYRIYRFFTSALDFGLAQRRGRFLMIGIRKDVSAIVPLLQKSPNQATVRMAIGDLPPPPDDYSEHPDYPNHARSKVGALNEERFRHVPPGGGWFDIPPHLRLDCHSELAGAISGGWPDVYGRLEWTSQAGTITAGFDSFTRGRFGHPEQHRPITLREGARLQGFPDGFRFLGSRAQVRLQIGNAVPPPLARAAGEALKRVLTGDGRVPQRALFPDEAR